MVTKAVPSNLGRSTPFPDGLAQTRAPKSGPPRARVGRADHLPVAVPMGAARRFRDRGYHDGRRGRIPLRDRRQGSRDQQRWSTSNSSSATREPIVPSASPESLLIPGVVDDLIERLSAGRARPATRVCERSSRRAGQGQRGSLTQIQTGLSRLPHSFSGAAQGRPDRLAELTPIPEMADEARNVAQPPSDVSHGRRA